MNIIFIGPDGSGKTTMSKILQQKLSKKGYTYYKGTYAEPDKYNLSKDLISKSKNTIFDRFYYPDDMIYSRIKGTPLTAEQEKQYKELEASMLNNEFCYIFVTAPTFILEKRLGERGDDYIETTDLKAIKDAYEDFINSTDIPIVRIKTDSFSTAAENVESLMIDLEFINQLYGNKKTFINKKR